jgi:peptidoglycan/LPS O-acetylase OafA/YrhL
MMGLAATALFGFGITATAWPAIFESAYSNPTSAVILIFENVFVLGQEMLYWFKIAPDGALFLDLEGGLPTEEEPVAWQALLVPQSWSLSMELMFYAVAPFLARLGWRTLAILAAASIALRFSGHLLPVEYGLWQGRFFPTALFMFLFGMLAHRAMPFAARLPKAFGWLAAFGALALVVCQPMLGLPDEAGRWLIYLAIAGATPFVFNAFKDNAIDRWIGELSYPMYLSHLLIVALVLTFQPPFAAWVAIGATLGVSAMFLVFIDGPVDRWRQRRAQLAQSAETAPAMAQLQT